MRPNFHFLLYETSALWEFPHINTDHPNWKEEFFASQKLSELFLNLEPVATAKAQNIYGWMEMIIMNSF